MTIYDILKSDIDKLRGIRVPVEEQALYHQVSEVLEDLRACVNAIEQSDAQAHANNEAEPATDESETEPKEIGESE